ncbi:prepilin-type N-terminal cleavage/methylation domain-containing protein, partial [Moraxella lacunata]
LPAYQDYISKSQTTRVVGELAAGKTAVDAALFEGKTPVLGGTPTVSQEDIGLTTTGGAARSNLLSKVAIGGGNFATGAGTIEGTLGNRANKDIHGTVIIQNRNVDGTWNCKITGAGTGWKEKFIPTGCTK